jgi:hypothetical protein
MPDRSNQPERPRSEPEIIPPDRNRHQSEWRPYASGAGTERIFVARLGPFSMAMLFLAFAVLVAVVMLAILGAVLLWIPLVLLVVAAAAVLRFLRR